MKAHNLLKEHLYKRYLSRLIIFLLIFSFLKIVYLSLNIIDLSPDEAHFWEWSRHLAWGYYDQGPLTAFIIKLTTSLFGTNELSVRLGAIIFSFGISVALFFFTKELFDIPALAFLMGILINIVPLGFVGGIIFTYHTLQVFFWTLSLIFFLKAIKENKPRYWLITGICLGLGFMSYFLIIVCAGELVLFIILSEKYRGLLRSRNFYLAIGAFIIVSSPMLIWNATHNWVMIRHALGFSFSKQVETPSLHIKEALEFIGSQAGVISPLLFLIEIWGLYQLTKMAIVGRDETALFIIITSLPLFLIVLISALSGRAEANWPSAAHVTALTGSLGLFFRKLTIVPARRSKRMKRLLRYSIIMAAFISLISLEPSLLRYVGISHFYNNPKLDPTTRIKGWEELGKEVTRILQKMPRPDKTFIASHGYGIPSLLSFYVKGHPTAYSINIGRRMNQYDLWEDPNGLIGNDAIYVAVRRSKMSNELKKCFYKVEEPIEFLIVRRNSSSPHILHRFFIFKCFDFKGLPKRTFSSF